MVHSDQAIALLIRHYASIRGLSVSYASRLLTGNGDTLARLDAGTSLTARRAQRILETASIAWPTGAAWPSDLPRPEFSDEQTPSATFGLSPADLVAKVEDAKDAMLASMTADPPDMEEFVRRETEMLRAALTLRADGRIASVKAVCLALNSTPNVYDTVVRRYADGRGGRQPRDPKSHTGRMLAALVASGDVRFSERRAAS